MKKIGMICLLLLCAVIPHNTIAGGKATNDQQLADLLSKIKTADGYSFDITVVSEIQGSDEKPETIKMTNYQSRDQFIIYSKSDDNFFFLCKNGQFRVNIKEKAVYYHAFDSSAELKDLQKEWKDPSFTGVVDSFFLRNANIAEKKKDKKTIRYKLKYPADSKLLETNIGYNIQTSFFNSISYVFKRERTLPGNKTFVVKQKVTMDNYRQKAPNDVQNLLAETQSMLAYLQRTYKGYAIRPI